MACVSDPAHSMWLLLQHLGHTIWVGLVCQDPCLRQ